MVEYTNFRISKLRDYLIKEINEIAEEIGKDKLNQINANMLAEQTNNYSLDKIPTASTVEKWINGGGVNQDTYSLRSRQEYSQETIENLFNIGFFEMFETKINSNNKEGILPEITGIQSIKCLNCGGLAIANSTTAEFEIQIQIEYEV